MLLYSPSACLNFVIIIIESLQTKKGSDWSQRLMKRPKAI